MINEAQIRAYINSNPSDFTVQYAMKLLERSSICIDNETANSDLEKYVLYKTMASDVCFACELLLKSKINDYNNGHDFSSWTSHNLQDIFNTLSPSDQAFICAELNITNSTIQNTLQDNATSDAFIRRYLYESQTGIPNYTFLCDFASALAKLNGKTIPYDIKRIDILPSTFDTTQFDFSDVVKTHSELIYRKAQIFDLDDFTDDNEEYIVRNMKSCDYAFFSEIRFKYFDKNQNPRQEHEFSKLHNRLRPACNFLVGKGQYMRRYMNSASTVNFEWSLESLMFNERFIAGDPLTEVYRDLNQTFESSRFCTTEYYENYYSAQDFAETIKSITDLLMVNEAEADKIFETKEKIIEKYGIDFLITKGFTALQMRDVDLDYLDELTQLTHWSNLSKHIILAQDQEDREKYKFFIKENPKLTIPNIIQNVVSKDENGKYSVDMNKYRANKAFEDRYLILSEDRIDAFLKLENEIDFEDLVVQIVQRELDVETSIKRYKEMKAKITAIAMDNGLANRFLEDFGYSFIKSGDTAMLYKHFLLYKFFEKNGDSYFRWEPKSIERLDDVPLEDIGNQYSLFKKYKLESIYLEHVESIKDIRLDDLKEKLGTISAHFESLSDFISDPDIFNVDLDRLVNFLDAYKEKFGECQGFRLIDFEHGKVEEAYDLLESKNLSFLYKNPYLIYNIKPNDTLREILDTDLMRSASSRNFDQNDIMGIGLLMSTAMKYEGFKDVLIDLLDTNIVKDNPKVLYVLDSSYNTLECIYRINVFNTWYDKIKTNNIQCVGTKIELPQDKRDEICSILVESAQDSFHFEIDQRLESVFSNSQLVYSLDKNILVSHDIDFMNDTVKQSKFKYKDFSNFNYFGNLFNTIRYNNLDPQKMFSLLNTLYSAKKDSNVTEFIKKLCSCHRQHGT